MNVVYNTRYIFTISLISALGGYLFGFDFAVISGALPFLKTQFGLNAYWEGFTTGSLALGCIAGCVLAGRISESFGRRTGLMVAATIFALSSLAMAFAPALSFFIISRFVAGIGVGMASMLSPMYIAEVSPAPIRGRMVALNQLAIVVGILITNIVNYLLRDHGADSWRWMFGCGFIPSSIFFAGICFLPESPRWLIKAGKTGKAKIILSRMGGESFAIKTTADIQSAIHSETQRIPYITAFKKPFLGTLMVGIGLAVFQQFCGINVVFNYTATIFKSVGFNEDDQLMQTVFIGAVNLLFTCFAMGLVDKVGRKPLMLAGAGGLCVLYLIISWMLQTNSYFSTYFLLAAIGLYASTIAPVTWVLISEIFPNKVRDVSTSIAVIALWAAYFILTFTFPILAEVMGGVANTFYIYAVVCLLGAIFIWRNIRETKGKTLEEMDTIFAH